MGGRRIFLAIDISDAAREVCTRHIEHLRSQFPKARVGWEKPEKLHVTLKFLGDTADEVLEQLGQRISEVARDGSVFPTALSRTGVFPDRSHPRIIWLGLEDLEDRLRRVHQSIDAVCAEFGYEKEPKRFTPHITIGRVREPQSAADLAGAHLEMGIEPVELVVSEIVIYESKLQPGGSVYSTVSSIQFGAV